VVRAVGCLCVKGGRGRAWRWVAKDEELYEDRKKQDNGELAKEEALRKG
jgi:hypothetical protein